MLLKKHEEKISEGTIWGPYGFVVQHILLLLSLPAVDVSRWTKSHKLCVTMVTVVCVYVLIRRFLLSPRWL